MERNRKPRFKVTGLRLAPDARDLLYREAERTDRFPARVLADLIRKHLAPPEEPQEKPSRPEVVTAAR